MYFYMEHTLSTTQSATTYNKLGLRDRVLLISLSFCPTPCTHTSDTLSLACILHGPRLIPNQLPAHINRRVHPVTQRPVVRRDADALATGLGLGIERVDFLPLRPV